MVWADKTLCEMMLRLLDRPEYAQWSGQCKDIRDLRDLLALSSQDEESALLGDFFRRNQPFWHAASVDLTGEVLVMLQEWATESFAIRQYRPLTAAEEEKCTRVADLFKTIHGFNMKRLEADPRTKELKRIERRRAGKRPE